ncbi:MAG: tetratricopeptide repeat protein [candidate division KSB1 bacterium]|nr:tetratricopeptide repeat protein [candidate division KSB1 bacterium]MDZ7275940.1 tetratricopeptide repeat protein [candidate division KSB1 bacterium]MDZ7285778.1 tetratricopeptide repeat protein [candidate division KSB1 bacterium]MDZ7298810.1 tetratricopeptide repeat protein [candidate division KSB1 bacterium]MDZ7349675.1 tetratricopeptide repeat protein [candidate division KSB1 bacterium]
MSQNHHTFPAGRLHLAMRVVGIIVCTAATFARSQTPVSNPAAADDYLYAQKLYQEGYHELCVSQLEAFLQRYPDAAELADGWRLLGQANLALRRHAAAEQALRQFDVRFPQHPGHAEVLLLLAESQRQQRKLQEAALTCRRLVYFHPRSEQAPLAAYQAGELLLAAGDREAGRASLYEMMDKYDNSPLRLQAHLLLVQSFLESGEHQRGLQEAERLFRIFPASELGAQAYFVRARLQEALGQYQLAEEGYRTLLQRHPKGEWSRRAQLQLSEIAFARGDVNAALAALAAVAAEAPAVAELNEVALRTAAMNLALGKAQAAEEALKKFEASLADSVSRLTFFYLQGSVAEQTGNAAAARAAYGQACALPAALEPQTSTAGMPRLLRQRSFWRNAQLAFAAQDYTAARHLCRQYRREYPNGEYRDVLLLLEADIHRQGLHNPAYAQKLYFELLEDHPRSPHVDEAQFALAESFAAAGEQQLARLQWQRFLQLYAASELAPAAARQLRLRSEFEPVMTPEIIRQLGETVLQLSRNPGTAPAALVLARLHFQSRDFEAAVRYSREALAEPQAADLQREATYLLGVSCYRLAEREQLAGRPATAWRDSAAAVLESLQREGAADRYATHAGELLVRLALAGQAADTTALLRRIDLLLSNAADDAGLDDVRLWAAVARKQRATPGDSVAARQIVLALQRVAAAENSDHHNQALWELADWQMKQKNMEAARKTLALLEQSPRHDATQARGQLLLARWLRRQGEYDAALTALAALQERFFYCAYADSARREKLQVLIAAGRLQEALRVMEEAGGDGRDYAGSDGLDLQRGRLQEASGNYGPAIHAYLRFLELHPQAPEAPAALLATARLSRQVGAGKLAAAYFEECLRRFPQTPEAEQARLQLAALRFDKGEFSEALGLYVAFMQERPESPLFREAMKQAILCLYKTNNPARAEAEVKAFRERFKEDRESLADFQYAAGELALQEKNFAQAEEIFKKLGRDYRGSPAGILGDYGLGKAQLLQNKTREALETLTAIPERYPKHPFLPTVYLGLGDFYLTNQQWDNAIEAFTRVIKDSTFDNNYKLAVRSLIDVYDRIALKDRALALARHYLNRFPEDPKTFDLRLKCALLLNDLQQYDDAIALLRRLKPAADATTEPEVQYYLGKSYMNAGRFENAIAELLRVKFFSKPTKLPWDVIALYDAAICYTRLGNCTRARQLFQRIVREQGAASEFGRFANNKIAELGTCPEAN